MNESRSRIQLIDALRGLSVILMVAHHFLYDLVTFLGAPDWLFTNPVFDILHYLFAGLFILLSGISSRFSRSNIKRGLKVIGAALLVSLVSWFAKVPIIFGILHFLGFCMVFYGLTSRFFDKRRGILTLVVYAALLIATALFLSITNAVTEIETADGVYRQVSNTVFESGNLWIFGILQPEFYSGDYFPIFPWIFVFLSGTWLGAIIKDGKFPKWFYTVNPPLLPKVGKKAFVIYLLHQPVLFAITMLILQFIM